MDCIVSPWGCKESDKTETFTSTFSFPGGSDGKEAAYNAGGPGSISGSGKSPREENG